MFDFIVFHDALRFLIIALHLKCGVKTMGQSSYVFLLVISASFKQKNGEQEEHHFLCSSKWFPRLQSELEAQRGWVIGVFPWKRQSVWLIFYQSIQNRALLNCRAFAYWDKPNHEIHHRQRSTSHNQNSWKALQKKSSYSRWTWSTLWDKNNDAWEYH